MKRIIKDLNLPNRLYFLLAVSLAPAFSAAQQVRDYPFQGGIRYTEAAEYNCLSIVESIRNIGFDNRKDTPRPIAEATSILGKMDHKTWVEEVKVIDSVSLARGSKIRIVVHTGDIRISFPFVPGKRYLVIALGQNDGYFLEPTSRANSGVVGEYARESNEIAGVAAFETHAMKLSSGDTPAWRLVNSIFDTLADSSDTAFRRTVTWFSYVGYPEVHDSENLFGRKIFPFAQRLLYTVEQASAYRRAKIYQVLCRWKVFGMEEPYVRALIEASKIPGSWTAPEDNFDDGGLGYSMPLSGNVNYKWLHLTAQEWVDAVLSSKSIQIRSFLLTRLDTKTTEEQDRRLAVLLNDPSDGVKAEIVTHLARNYHVPMMGYIEGDRYEHFAWKNKDEAVNYWRKRFGVIQP